VIGADLPVRPENWEAVAARINRKYEDALRRGNEQARVEHISTGSPELDVAMRRGVPRGRFTRLYGGFGSTKTMTALSCIAEAQRIGLNCVLFNIEKRYEEEFARSLGVDTKKLHVVSETSIEAIGDIWESLLGVAHFFVLDSCSVAVSEDELNCDIRDWRPGISARAWGKVFRRINERWDQVDNTAILIDQVRVDFKTGQENPTGGRIFDHQSAMSVLFRAGKWLYRDENGVLDKDAKQNRGPDEQTVPAGREIKIRIEKSSVCRPFRTATLHYDLDTLEYDRVFEYMKAAKHYKIITGGGGGHYQYIDDDGTVTRLRGENQLREFISGSQELQQYIHETAIQASEETDLQEDHLR
jgi:RecA/RadA recombinase